MARKHQTKEHRQWKDAVRERDGYKCALTGTTKRLEVHHLNHASYFPDERYDIDNGVTINRAIHLYFHWVYKKSTRQKCTKDDWKRFVRFFKYIRYISTLLNKTT